MNIASVQLRQIENSKIIPSACDVRRGIEESEDGCEVVMTQRSKFLDARTENWKSRHERRGEKTASLRSNAHIETKGRDSRMK